MTDYYVYALLDPRKPGPFRYGRWVFSHEPFYIGKGQGSRAEFHHRYDVNYNDTHKTRKIKKILRETGMPPIVIYKKLHLSESAAMKFERVLISSIGRGTNGPLTNLTDGGEGRSGSTFNHTTSTKRKIGRAVKKAYLRQTDKQRAVYSQKRSESAKVAAANRSEADKQRIRQKRVQTEKALSRQVRKQRSEKLSRSTSNWWRTATPEQIKQRCIKSSPGKGKMIKYQGRDYHFIDLHRKLNSTVPYSTAYARVFKYGQPVRKAFGL